MEVGSEVYSMALSLSLQKIVGSPLTQELRLSPAATNVAAASLESMMPRTSAWNASDVIIMPRTLFSTVTSLSNPVFSDVPFQSLLDLHLTDYSGGSFSNGSDPNYYDNSSASQPFQRQDLELYYRHSTAMSIVYGVAYFIVFLVGIVGNSFVVAVVLRSPRMRTVTNYFIVNLAIADILVIIFCLPATLMSNIFVRK